uniref:Uncharacterized protein n=1 Tax=Timspurckia oligopyrenoides TaxID=708627 RepID=A0A7S1EQ08_9RHOD|mmetsp:Transcript_11162/g.20160  ORF Transcript_11162/g.20160 Transcript_11162/m.20160 type:complete len:152 (+) Transcript_11162:111-566(+)
MGGSDSHQSAEWEGEVYKQRNSDHRRYVSRYIRISNGMLTGYTRMSRSNSKSSDQDENVNEEDTVYVPEFNVLLNGGYFEQDLHSGLFKVHDGNHRLQIKFQTTDLDEDPYVYTALNYWITKPKRVTRVSSWKSRSRSNSSRCSSLSSMEN